MRWTGNYHKSQLLNLGLGKEEEKLNSRATILGAAREARGKDYL
jgi:hypothetical protein